MHACIDMMQQDTIGKKEQNIDDDRMMDGTRNPSFPQTMGELQPVAVRTKRLPSGGREEPESKWWLCRHAACLDGDRADLHTYQREACPDVHFCQKHT